MIRVIVVLGVLASFNCIAMLLFMSGQADPYLMIFAPQEVIWVVIGFLVLVDILLIKVFLLSGGGVYYGDFEQVFRKYYDGKNYEEAFRRAHAEFRGK